MSSKTIELNPIVAELAKRLLESSEGREQMQRFLESYVYPSLNLAVLGNIDEPEVIRRVALILHTEIELDFVRRREKLLMGRLFAEQTNLHKILCRLLSLPANTNLFIDWRRMVVQKISPKVE